jgi:hypothetical protein
MDILDELMEQLDQIWENRPADDGYILRLIQSIPSDYRLRGEVAIELCAADLEWRWRTSERERGVALSANSPDLRASSDSLLQMGIGPPSASSSDGFIVGSKRWLSMTPRASDYQPFLWEWWSSCGCRQKMYLAEWQVRSSFGDQPEIFEFRKLWPNEPEWSRRLQLELDLLGFIRICVSRQGRELLVMRLPAEFTIGRQHRDEPAPPAWVNEQCKLVVADVGDTNLSRQQFQLTRTRLTEIQMTNSSRNVGISIDSAMLLPKQSRRLKLPIKMSVGDLTLKFEIQTE